MIVRSVCELERDAEVCYRAFCDVEAVPRWLNRIDAVTITQHHSDGMPAEVRFVATEEGGQVSYTLLYTYDRPGRRVTWRPEEPAEHVVAGFAAFAGPGEGSGSCEMIYVLKYGAGWGGDPETEQERADKAADAFARYVRALVAEEQATL